MFQTKLKLRNEVTGILKLSSELDSSKMKYLLNLSIKKQSEFQNKDYEKEKLVILNQIKVLELDHDIGNISLNDFKVEKEILKRKVSKLYKELKV